MQPEPEAEFHDYTLATQLERQAACLTHACVMSMEGVCAQPRQICFRASAYFVRRFAAVLEQTLVTWQRTGNVHAGWHGPCTNGSQRSPVPLICIFSCHVMCRAEQIRDLAHATAYIQTASYAHTDRLRRTACVRASVPHPTTRMAAILSLLRACCEQACTPSALALCR